jgi:hypothetical protein
MNEPGIILSHLENMWKAPPSRFLKANFDVAVNKFFSNSAVISDDKGEIIAATASKFDSTEVNFGEA